MSIYAALGVTPIVNGSGTVTRLGGPCMSPAVRQAFLDANQVAVSMDELQATASRRIAETCGTQAGLVTGGSAAALTLGAAAILAGSDLSKMERLPHTDEFANEFVMAREQRNGYDHAVRAAGARLVEVGFHEIVAGAGVRRTEAWEYKAAVGPRTAGFLYVLGPDAQPPLSDVVKIAREQQLPVLVDAAGELPPRRNLREIATTGADLVAFSGGKALRGPQSSGILCGRRDLITSAALQMLDMDDHFELWSPPADWIDKSALEGIPRHGIGRGLKVSKEEIVALLVALEEFQNDGLFFAQRNRWRSFLETVATGLEDTTLSCRIVDDPAGERPPLLEIELDEMAAGCDAFEVCRRLRAGTPPVYLGHGRLADGILTVTPTCLDEAGAAQIAPSLISALAAGG